MNKLLELLSPPPKAVLGAAKKHQLPSRQSWTKQLLPSSLCPQPCSSLQTVRLHQCRNPRKEPAREGQGAAGELVMRLRGDTSAGTKMSLPSFSILPELKGSGFAFWLCPQHMEVPRPRIECKWHLQSMLKQQDPCLHLFAHTHKPVHVGWFLQGNLPLLPNMMLT